MKTTLTYPLLSTNKIFFEGTQRTTSPSDTLKRITPYLQHAGITRIANITGLDRIGIPVTISIRPKNKSLCTSSGKGTTLEQAFVSAAMESLEFFHAENLNLDCFVATYDELQLKYQMINLNHFLLRKYSLFHPQLRIKWLMGFDIVNQKEVPVPFEIITMDFHAINAKGNIPYFQTGSNGLASGNHLLEAIISAIYEIIERDAITINKIKEQNGYKLENIITETIPYEKVQLLLEQFQKAKIFAVIFNLTLDLKVPTFGALIYDEQSKNIGSFSGYGTHLNPEIAMLRALTEAAQNRCVYISGARDNIFSHDVLKSKNSAGITPNKKSGIDIMAYNFVDESDPISFESDLKKIIYKLQDIQLTQIIVVDLTMPEFNLPVVKVVIPGLEGYISELYSPGIRAPKITNLLPNDGKLHYQNMTTHFPANKGY